MKPAVVICHSSSHLSWTFKKRKSFVLALHCLADMIRCDIKMDRLICIPTYSNTIPKYERIIIENLKWINQERRGWIWIRITKGLELLAVIERTKLTQAPMGWFLCNPTAWLVGRNTCSYSYRSPPFSFLWISVFWHNRSAFSLQSSRESNSNVYELNRTAAWAKLSQWSPNHLSQGHTYKTAQSAAQLEMPS